ncbi:MAG TPA: lysozyme inhibitor LprI family protein [Nordella sp.]|nr:lysozyme inhibitor LprI family protein [Nordella sp.]
MRIAKTLLSCTPLLFFFGVTPAVAFDCAKAQSPVEKAICADDKLKTADDAMAAAYVSLREALTQAERKGFTASQRKWIKSREDSCGYQEGPERTSCILEQTEERRRLFLAAPESGPGTGARMVPVFIQQDSDPHHFDVDYTLIRFAAPKSRGENLFNAEVDKIVKGAPLKRQAEAAPEGMNYASYSAMAITYASPNFLSAKVEGWENTGGAHGNGGTSAINVDLKRGAALKVSDLFDEKGLSALKADCVAQIAVQKKEKNDGQDFDPANDPNYQESAVVEQLKSLDGWNFWQDKAIVTFNAYAIGSYAEGAYECEFPMAKLKSLTKPGALLPE